MTRTKIKIVVFIIYLAISMLSLRTYIFSEHGTSIHALSGDPNLFLKIYGNPSSWDNHLSRPSSPTHFLSHIFYLPFVYICILMGKNMFQMLPWVLSMLLTTAGFSMYILLYSLLRTADIKYWANVIHVSAFLAGLYYMSYPFFAIGEITEPFVLFCFSLFPFIVHGFIMGVEKNRHSFIVASVLLSSYLGYVDIRYLLLPFIIYITYIFYYTLSRGKTGVKLLPRFVKIFFIIILLFMATNGVNTYIFVKMRGATETVEIPLNLEAFYIPWKEASPLKLISGYGWFLLPNQVDWDSMPMTKDLCIVLGIAISLFSIITPMFVTFFRRIKKKNLSNLLLITLYFELLVAMTLVIASNKTIMELIWLSNEFNIGRLFRTPRIPAQIISLSISILFGISIAFVLRILTESRNFKFKYSKILVNILAVLLITTHIVTYSWPFFSCGTINMFLGPVDPSEDYMEVYNYLRTLPEDHRVFWLYFQAPFWYRSQSGKSMFYIYNSPLPTIWAQDNRWVHFMDFVKRYLVTHPDVDMIADILSEINVKYIVLANESLSTSYQRRLFQGLLNSMLESRLFKLLFANKHYYVFEIELDTPKFYTRSVILLGGGLKTLAGFLKKYDTRKYNYTILFIDDEINSEILENAALIVLAPYENYVDLAVHFVNKNYVIPLAQYNPSCAKYLTDPHHGAWHFVISHLGEHLWEYSYSIKYGFCVLTDTIRRARITIHVNKTGFYEIYIRLLKGRNVGKLKVTLDNNMSFIVDSRDFETASAYFSWVGVGNVFLKSGKHVIEIINLNNMNVVNLVMLIPKSDLQKIYTHLLGVEIDKIKYINYIVNPSFEEGLKNWSKPKYGFYVTIDKNIKYEGNSSLKVYTDIKDPGQWSLIKQHITKNVTKGIYIVRACMKCTNAAQSHIAIDTMYDGKLRRSITLTCNPKRNEWQCYCIEKYMSNSTKIVISLNAGWVLNPEQGNATTWFDSIVVSRLDYFVLQGLNNNIGHDFNGFSKDAVVLEYAKLDSTSWSLEINAYKPFMLVFTESYDPLWEARIYKDGRLINIVRSVPVYGVINGFWINETGNLTVVIRYVPQDWFELGLKISAVTFAFCIFYLMWDWRRDRGDKWAVWLEKRVKLFVKES